MNIGQRIANFRKEKHITQEQLGEAVGVTNRTVSKWESGVSSPGIDLIPAIASALSVSLDSLFGTETKRETDGIAEKTIDELKLEITDAVEYALAEAIRDALPDALQETLHDELCELLPKYLASPENKDEYSLLIISRDKSTVCRFYGQGQIVGPLTLNKQPSCYCISVPAQGGNVLFSGYESKEAAAGDLDRIFKAYSARSARIEL